MISYILVQVDLVYRLPWYGGMPGGPPIPGGGNCIPPGGEPEGAPPGGGNEGGIPLGIPESIVRISNTNSGISHSTYQAGSWAYQEAEQILAEVLVEAEACLSIISILRATLATHVSPRSCIPAGNPGGIPPGGIGNPGGSPAGGSIPPGGPKPGGAVFSIGLFADCPSAAYEFVMLSMTLCAFSWPICW